VGGAKLFCLAPLSPFLTPPRASRSKGEKSPLKLLTTPAEPLKTSKRQIARYPQTVRGLLLRKGE